MSKLTIRDFPYGQKGRPLLKKSFALKDEGKQDYCKAYVKCHKGSSSN